MELKPIVSKPKSSVPSDAQSIQEICRAANKCVPPRGHHEKLGTTLAILTSDNGSYDEPLTDEISVKGALRVFLAVDFEKEVFQFSHDGTNWIPIGPDFESAKLSDEHCGG